MDIQQSFWEEGRQGYHSVGKARKSRAVYSRDRHSGRESVLLASCPAHCGQDVVDYLEELCGWHEPILEMHRQRGLGLKSHVAGSWQCPNHGDMVSELHYQGQTSHLRATSVP